MTTVRNSFDISMTIETQIGEDDFRRMVGARPGPGSPNEMSVSIELGVLEPGEAKPVALWGATRRHVQAGSVEDRLQALRLAGSSLTYHLPRVALS